MAEAILRAVAPGLAARRGSARSALPEFEDLREQGRRRYLLPGEGTLDLRGFLDGLAQRGYSGAVTLEASALNAAGELDQARLDQVAAAVRQLSG